jgi:uncharacterized protein GlcG (DUF336 family)
MKKLVKTVSAAAIAMAVSMPAMAQDNELVVSVKRLTLDTAAKVGMATIEACREQGIQAGVTVVDRNGIVQFQARDTVAPVITLGISEGKAYAAANFMVNSSGLAERADGPIGRVPGVVMSAGAVLIEAGGSVYGAVGVSGAPSGETDEACAQAGLDAVKDDLEMM